MSTLKMRWKLHCWWHKHHFSIFVNHEGLWYGCQSCGEWTLAEGPAVP